MKLAVHWLPSVNSWTPGWMVAVAAGAHAAVVRAATDGAAAATGAMRVVAATAEMMSERVRMAGERGTSRKLAASGRKIHKKARTRAGVPAARITTTSAAARRHTPTAATTRPAARASTTSLRSEARTAVATKPASSAGARRTTRRRTTGGRARP